MSSENLECPLCGADSIKVFESFQKCLNCELHFKHPEDLVSFEREKHRYLEHNNSVDDEGYLKYLGKLLDCIPRLEEPILDFGCGPSKGLEALLKKRKIQKSVLSYDPYFFDEDLSDQKFKTIYASECVEHFNKPKVSMDKLINLMSKDSILAIRTELYSEDKGALEKWWYFKDPTHVCFYTTKTMRWVSKKYALNILKLESPYIIYST